MAGLTLEGMGVTQGLDLRLRHEAGGPILKVQCSKRARGKGEVLETSPDGARL